MDDDHDYSEERFVERHSRDVGWCPNCGEIVPRDPTGMLLCDCEDDRREEEEDD